MFSLIFIENIVRISGETKFYLEILWITFQHLIIPISSDSQCTQCIDLRIAKSEWIIRILLNYALFEHFLIKLIRMLFIIAILIIFAAKTCNFVIFI